MFMMEHAQTSSLRWRSTKHFLRSEPTRIPDSSPTRSIHTSRRMVPNTAEEVHTGRYVASERFHHRHVQTRTCTSRRGPKTKPATPEHITTAVAEAVAVNIEALMMQVCGVKVY